MKQELEIINTEMDYTREELISSISSLIRTLENELRRLKKDDKYFRSKWKNKKKNRSGNRSDKELLSGYKKDKDEPYRDGNDFYPGSMSKKELASSLRSIRQDVVRRKEDSQRGPRL